MGKTPELSDYLLQIYFVPSIFKTSFSFIPIGRNSEQNDDVIIRNLSTLKFDAGIVEPMARELLFLRRRSQLLTANIVAHAVFTVSILSEVKRQVCCAEKSTNRNHKHNHMDNKRQRLVYNLICRVFYMHKYCNVCWIVVNEYSRISLT